LDARARRGARAARPDVADAPPLRAGRRRRVAARGGRGSEADFTGAGPALRRAQRRRRRRVRELLVRGDVDESGRIFVGAGLAPPAECPLRRGRPQGPPLRSGENVYADSVSNPSSELAWADAHVAWRFTISTKSARRSRNESTIPAPSLARHVKEISP